MEEKGISSIFVIDKQHQLKGLLTIEAALESIRNDRWEKDLLVQDFYTTSPDTPLSDLITIAANTKYPIAVTEGIKLVGIIVRVSILSGLILGKEKYITEDREKETVHA